MSTTNDASHYIYSYPASELEDLLRDIRSSKQSGALTIHFSQGSPAGAIEWKEKLKPKPPSTSPLSNLVNSRQK